MGKNNRHDNGFTKGILIMCEGIKRTIQMEPKEMSKEELIESIEWLVNNAIEIHILENKLNVSNYAYDFWVKDNDIITEKNKESLKELTFDIGY